MQQVITLNLGFVKESWLRLKLLQRKAQEQVSGPRGRHSLSLKNTKLLGAGIVINFIQKQLDASERLFNMMVEDNKMRTQNLQMWVDMNESFQKKL
ncbi:MAG: hypothetical protein EB117_15560, partial [Betaproteobacteria bacterium]|nr:hypothetical protein [Betaproteobacteria bacterium]